MIGRVLTIHPHKGVEKIRFGMSRAEVRQAIGGAPDQFRRSVYGLEEDRFADIGLFVSYDELDHCNAVSISHGFGVGLLYESTDLFARSAVSVRSWASLLDPLLDPKDGFCSKMLGLSMWADWIDEPDLDPAQRQAPAESFMVFRPGYHENEQVRLLALRSTEVESR